MSHLFYNNDWWFYNLSSSEGVRNISNQLSIGTKIDMMSPNLVEEAKSLGLYSDTGGSFNFTKTFSDDVSLDRRYVCGRRMLQQYSKQGENSSKLDWMHLIWDFINQLGPSWFWSYGSGIYNYPCNHWLSSL